MNKSVDYNLLIKRKKLLYRSWHRGCKEMDILLGEFAMNNINSMTEKEIHDYEKIVDLDDHELYQYITGKTEIPETLNRTLMYGIINYKK